MGRVYGEFMENLWGIYREREPGGSLVFSPYLRGKARAGGDGNGGETGGEEGERVRGKEEEKSGGGDKDAVPGWRGGPRRHGVHGGKRKELFFQGFLDLALGEGEGGQGAGAVDAAALAGHDFDKLGLRFLDEGFQ